MLQENVTMENKDDFMYRWNDSDENNLFIYK